jgi:hypothetical protein
VKIAKAIFLSWPFLQVDDDDDHKLLARGLSLYSSQEISTHGLVLLITFHLPDILWLRNEVGSIDKQAKRFLKRLKSSNFSIQDETIERHIMAGSTADVNAATVGHHCSSQREILSNSTAAVP